MTQIFVSYSRESQDIVKTMVKDIEDLGHNAWFDQELTGGQAWWDQILDRIRKCNIFVYALTPQALESHACKLELDYAYKLKKTILPILVADGVSTNLLPTTLSEIQFADYRHKDKQAVIAVNKAINNLPAAQPLPDPLPKPPKVPTSYLGNLTDQIETTETLTLQEQSTLVLRLEEGLKEIENSNDVRHLLERLRKREDLFAKVANKIDDMLSSVTSPSAEPNLPEEREVKENGTPAKKSRLIWLLPSILVPFIGGMVVLGIYLDNSQKSVTKEEIIEQPVITKPKFRSTPVKKLSENPAKSMLKDKGFFDSDLNKSAKNKSPIQTNEEKIIRKKSDTPFMGIYIGINTQGTIRLPTTITFKHLGDKVTGTYTLSGMLGTMNGTVSGNTYNYVWKLGAYSGRGVSIIQGNTINGTWGYDSSDNNGGTLTAQLQ